MASERKTIVTYKGTGSQKVFAFPFDYLRKSFIKVMIDGNQLTYGTDYTVSDKQLTFTNAPVLNAIIVIYRETATDRLVAWEDASVLRAGDLTLFEVQLLHIAEETKDKVQEAGLALDDLDGKWDARLKVLKNLLDPVDNLDAVNKRYFDEFKGTVLDAKASEAAARVSETNAKASEAAARASETNAKASEAAARASETNAKASETVASQQAGLAKQYSDQAIAIGAGQCVVPTWAVASRPKNPLKGVAGFNTDLNVIECWTGTEWTRISGGRKGDIKMWAGPTSAIETGWVLCNGQTISHPEGGTITVPDLRDRFIVGAGNSYTVGATGGEATHALTVSEMPAHYHTGNTDARGAHNHATSIVTNRAYNSTFFPIDYSMLSLAENKAGAGSTTVYSNWCGDHAHIFSTSIEGGGQPHENRPPYYALCFLYKL